eukprot:CAMPEP_0174727712 /NCGR_PEP_ID=MMETSP1094-20130205/50332_1 /TAXON_ID=156173 /ORGANISM="Chrysochromulina brevifilum, Strain UTEX LB 985" /LENGTH=126 /DNA_ID=CAMNT_0015929517 /DNA_START=105 /DNA_END=486 /DNA_ORIENTATION=-
MPHSDSQCMLHPWWARGRVHGTQLGWSHVAQADELSVAMGLVSVQGYADFAKRAYEANGKGHMQCNCLERCRMHHDGSCAGMKDSQRRAGYLSCGCMAQLSTKHFTPKCGKCKQRNSVVASEFLSA